MFQIGDKVEIVDDNHLLGFGRVSKHYSNGDVCKVVENFYGLFSIKLVDQPHVSNILLSTSELKAIRKI